MKNEVINKMGKEINIFTKALRMRRFCDIIGLPQTGRLPERGSLL